MIALVEININEGFLDLRDGVIEGDHGAGDDRDVHKVPKVTEVRSGMENEAQIQDFQGALHGEDGSEAVIGVAQYLVSSRPFIHGVL